ncbi:MAG: aminotransferase class I/II-fold pyridoxal phosphate-dependent enzyme [Armatimonadetes bacterium]|nr:aminotransferase class I/II-fold pyridoxal phosphate-dependent enzyme [Armatimonadota bacterium]
MRRHTAARVGLFTESVIREMTRLNNLHEAINLAQGFPDFDPPREIVEAAVEAVRGGVNQYAITWGAPNFRAALAEKMRWYNGVDLDPERHFAVTCGATEGMMATLLAIIDQGDEVIVFEPFYENYGPDALLSGATLRHVQMDLDAPGIPFDPEELGRAFTARTKAIIINTPHNPSGKVFARRELEIIAELCRRHDALAITDEVYEHILYDGHAHVSIASLPGMAERTITVNSLSKSYSVTGWRVGWVATASEDIANGIRRAHDFLTVGAPAPLQEAGVVCLRMPRKYYDELGRMYQTKRDILLGILNEAGFTCVTPQGAYYVMADISGFGAKDDVAFAHYLVKEIGVASVPGSSFYHEPAMGARYVRFAYPKRKETLEEVRRRLARLSPARTRVHGDR